MRCAPLLLVGCVCMLGCGNKNEQAMLDKLYPDRKPVFAVSGVVTVDGEPRKDLYLQLVPEGATKPDRSHPHTFTTEKGAFAFSTYANGDGVNSGKYKLLVEQLKSEGASFWVGPDGLSNLYNHLESPAAEIDVADKPVRNLKVELKLSGQSPKDAPSYGVSQIGNRSRMKK